ncbi:MAG: DUF6134 family protein [Gemmatimonadota bacterium]
MAAWTGTPTEIVGQAVTLDQGSFTLTVQGRSAGSETFNIRRLGTGDDARIIAQGQIRMEGPGGLLNLDPALQASGPDADITAYQVKVSGRETEEVYVTLGDRRFLTRVRSEVGEQEREYRAAPGTLVLDADVVHHYHFLGLRIDNGSPSSVPVIVPRGGRQYTLQISVQGNESLTVGGASVSSRRYRLEGEGESWDLWLDDRGRVLRLEMPAAGFIAQRDAAPG